MEVQGVGIYMMTLRSGKTLLLHDNSGIWRNLVSIFSLMKNGFTLSFEKNKVDFFLGGIYYVSGFAMDGFVVVKV